MLHSIAYTMADQKKKPAKKTSIIGNDASKIELLFIIFFLCLQMSLFDIGIILQNAELK